MKRFYEQHRNAIPYLFILAIVLASGYLRQQDFERQARRSCRSDVAQTIVLREFVLGFATGTPQEAAFREYVRANLEIPPDSCDGTGVDVRALFDAPSPPIQNPFASTTTTGGP